MLRLIKLIERNEKLIIKLTNRIASNKEDAMVFDLHFVASEYRKRKYASIVNCENARFRLRQYNSKLIAHLFASYGNKFPFTKDDMYLIIKNV